MLPSPSRLASGEERLGSRQGGAETERQCGRGGGGGWANGGRESCLKCRPKRWWAFPWKLFTAVSDIIGTGERRLGGGDGEEEGGVATEMRPDWLGLRHGSPLWSSAGS